MKRKIVLLLLLVVVFSCRKDSDLIPEYKIAPPLKKQEQKKELPMKQVLTITFGSLDYYA